jgi:ferritin-like metal-binding protein YciE
MNAIPAPLDDHFLKDVFTHHLNRIYNGKCFLHKSMPHLTSLASFKGLKLAMEEFGEDVMKQIVRMKLIYAMIGETPVDQECNPITNIVKDEFCLDENQTLPILNDLDLMLYVQLLEHVNITSYRMLIMLSKTLKYDNIIQLLKENLDESQDNDKLFTLIAKEYITKD